MNTNEVKTGAEELLLSQSDFCLVMLPSHNLIQTCNKPESPFKHKCPVLFSFTNTAFYFFLSLIVSIVNIDSVGLVLMLS